MNKCDLEETKKVATDTLLAIPNEGWKEYKAGVVSDYGPYSFGYTSKNFYLLVTTWEFAVNGHLRAGFLKGPEFFHEPYKNLTGPLADKFKYLQAVARAKKEQLQCEAILAALAAPSPNVVTTPPTPPKPSIFSGIAKWWNS